MREAFELPVGADLWCPMPGSPPARTWPTFREPRPQRIAKRLLPSYLKQGDPGQATRAARAMIEFVRSQLRLLDRRPAPRRRGPNRPPVDDRLWLDPERFVAWTLDGELVEVRDIDRTAGRNAPSIARLRPDDARTVFAVGFLVRTVIALYPRDRLDSGPVCRYLPHHDLRRAIRAALDRVKRLDWTPPAPSVRSSPSGTFRKTRFHPLGNFVAYEVPDRALGLPPFTVLLQGVPVPEAFESRRKASRRLASLEHRGFRTEHLTIARVVGAVQTRPVFRSGLDLPDDLGELLDIVRREPRVVQTELHAEWLPRFEQAEDGTWCPRRFHNRRTVRHGCNVALLRDLGRHARQVAGRLDDLELQRSVTGQRQDHGFDLDEMLRLPFKAQRRLPQPWLDRIGLPRDAIAPDWRSLRDASHEPPAIQDGHWLRAPFEFGPLHPDGLRRRIVELRIDDLASLLDVAGLRLTFWLVKESTSAAAKWVLPRRAQDLSPRSALRPSRA